MAAVALCGALLAAFLRPHTPVFGILTALICGLVLLYAVMEPIGQIFNALAGFPVSYTHLTLPTSARV